MAERKGLEPSASGVTGRRYNRLNYRSAEAASRIASVARQPVRIAEYEYRKKSDKNQMAERKGLEPSASGVTGRRYNRLNYRSVHGGQYRT